MPLKVSITDPHTGEPLPDAWAWGPKISLDYETKTGSITYKTYASGAAAYADPALKPIIDRRIEIKPDRQEAIHGSPPLISPYVPPEYETVEVRAPGTDGPDDPGEYRLEEVAPAQNPVYGPAPLLSPAVPSFDEMVADNPTIFGLLMGRIDQFGLDVVPEFAGGEIIPPGPPQSEDDAG